MRGIRLQRTLVGFIAQGRVAAVKTNGITLTQPECISLGMISPLLRNRGGEDGGYIIFQAM